MSEIEKKMRATALLICIPAALLSGCEHMPPLVSVEYHNSRPLQEPPIYGNYGYSQPFGGNGSWGNPPPNGYPQQYDGGGYGGNVGCQSMPGYGSVTGDPVVCRFPILGTGLTLSVMAQGNTALVCPAGSDLMPASRNTLTCVGGVGNGIQSSSPTQFPQGSIQIRGGTPENPFDSVNNAYGTTLVQYFVDGRAEAYGRIAFPAARVMAQNGNSVLGTCEPGTVPLRVHGRGVFSSAGIQCFGYTARNIGKVFNP